MQNQLDSFEVFIGDAVHDTFLGAGKVTALQRDGQFEVNFPDSKRRLTFNAGGVSGRTPQRTLFWHPPHVLPPPKEYKNWNEFTSVMHAVHGVMLGGVK
jgi:hypothetical protein